MILEILMKNTVLFFFFSSFLYTCCFNASNDDGSHNIVNQANSKMFVAAAAFPFLVERQYNKSSVLGESLLSKAAVISLVKCWMRI